MIAWGGYNGGTYLGDGARYRPSADDWAILPAAGAPSARSEHTAAWTGAEMIVWGGQGSGGYLDGGARFNPVVNTWAALSSRGRSLCSLPSHVRVDRLRDDRLGRI